MIFTIISGDIFSQEKTQFDVEALIVFKFYHFINYSDKDPIKNFKYCVYEDKEIYKTLRNVINKNTKSDMKYDVVKLEDTEGREKCNIVFLGRDYPNLKQKIETFPRPLVITRSGFNSKNGMVFLKTVDSRIRFDINKKNLEIEGVRLKYQVLKLADKVY